MTAKRITSKRTGPRNRKNTRQGSQKLLRLALLLVLGGVLAATVAAVCYVIFFQTALAQEVVTGQGRSEIVYEEPDPPVHIEDIEEESNGQIQQARVAIIIDDLGYDDTQARRLLNFPYELNYSFLPFAPYTKKLEALANRKNKTVLLHLPLEPRDYAWEPGPGTIYLRDSKNKRREKFVRALAEVPHAQGVNNHMGSRFTEDVPAMSEILQLIADRKMFFVDSFTSSASVGYRISSEMEMKNGRRAVFLDNDLKVDDICQQLEKLVRIAQKRGSAIGIAHPHKITVDALDSCMISYGNGVRFVSVLELL